MYQGSYTLNRLSSVFFLILLREVKTKNIFTWQSRSSSSGFYEQKTSKANLKINTFVSYFNSHLSVLCRFFVGIFDLQFPLIRTHDDVKLRQKVLVVKFNCAVFYLFGLQIFLMSQN